MNLNFRALGKFCQNKFVKTKGVLHCFSRIETNFHGFFFIDLKFTNLSISIELFTFFKNLRTLYVLLHMDTPAGKTQLG